MAGRSQMGELERRVMDHLWSAGSEERWFTVRQVHEELAHDREIAYTTVMTVLQRLAKKRLVLQARDGRAYLYKPTTSRGEMAAALMREALEGTGKADRRTALTRFVDSANPDEIATLRDALGTLDKGQRSVKKLTTSPSRNR